MKKEKRVLHQKTLKSYHLKDVTKEQASNKTKVFYDAWYDYNFVMNREVENNDTK